MSFPNPQGMVHYSHVDKCQLSACASKQGMAGGGYQKLA